MLSSSDRAQIWTWNAELPMTENICVHELVEKTAKANPDAEAVYAWDGILTYQELDRQSSCLAAWLKSENFGRGVIIPLLFEKSVYSTVALMGVMKAGAAFVQLDVNLPLSRMEENVLQTDAPLILTSQSNIDRARRLGPRYAVVGKNELTLQSLPSTSLKHADVHPSDTLYIMFTSGSTGRPKGAMVSHANYASAAKNQSAFVNISSKTRVFDFCSYAFDASIFFVLLTLIAGGCVCVPSELEKLESPEYTMTAMRATTMLATPAAAQMLDPLKTPTLQTLMTAGESLSFSIMKKWTKYLPVLNLFGPCECTALCTGVRFEKRNRESEITIGRGVGCVTWVVDAENPQELVPIGSIGELVIEGPSIGQGYLKDSKKTAKAFVENPPWLWCTDNGPGGRRGRVYLTGDLVQYNLNGSLTFLGRKDTQRKIRGQRVELGEVEGFTTQLLSDDVEVVAEICNALDAPDNNLLVVFLKFQAENPTNNGTTNGTTNGDRCTHRMNEIDHELIISANEELRRVSTMLKAMALKKLPHYMVPSVVFRVSSIPRILPSTKIDRRLLRNAVGALSRAQISEYEARNADVQSRSMTSIERSLQTVWADTLQMHAESIGVADHFFRLGGDSISAMQLISVGRSKGLEIRMADILGSPVLSEMAMTVKSQSSEKSSRNQIAPFALLKGIHMKTAIDEAARCCNVPESSIEDIYPCTPLQEGMMAISLRNPGSQIACTILEISADIDIPRLCASWIKTARENRIMRTRIVQLDNFGMLQVVLKDDLVVDTAESPEQYLTHHCNQSIGLGSKLIYLAYVGENRAGSRYIVRKMHHAICDGWQDRIIIEQVERAYRGQQLSKEIPFNAFVRYFLDQEHEAATRYWQEELTGAPPATFPAKLSATYSPWVTKSQEFFVSLPKNRELAEYTLSTSIRLALALTLGAYLQSDDVVLGIVLSGRNAPVDGIEQMTGPTIATVPFRIKLNSRENVRHSVHNLLKQSRAMIPFEQTGLQHIRRLAPEACDFQTLLVVQPPEQPSDLTIQKKLDDHPDEGLAFGSYGLVFECVLLQDEERIKVAAHVDTNLLHLDQAEKLTNQFGHVLRQIVTHPERLIGDIDKMCSEDVEQLVRWNENIPQAVDRTLHGLVKQQCLLQPTAQAVYSSDGGLDYAELDDFSSRLALHLRALCLQQNMVMPLFVGSSSLSAVAILGVLKCGGTCASLDATQPPERLNGIINKVDARMALATSSQIHMASVIDVPLIHLTRSFLNQLPSARDFRSSGDAHGPAFLVTTSGSTGIPKVIVLEHRALASSILAMIPFYRLTNSCRTLHFSSSAFDIFIYEHLATLIAGGCLCVPTEHEKMNGTSHFARTSRVNFALLTPTALKAFYDGETIPSLQLISLGGEPITSNVVDAWRSSATLVNGYGPAECCVCSAHYLNESNSHPLGTIGRPFGALFWIVEENDHTKLAPIGVVGELLIEGPTLARGYHQDTSQTAASFIDTPSWLRKLRPGAQGRLFKSGDLVKYNSDGTLVYVARKDNQVKLSGCRIELGEIEHHLSYQLGGVPVVAEVVRNKNRENVRLVAFVSMQNAQLESEEARKGILILADFLMIHSQPILQNLAKVLPGYMVPSILIPVRYIPQTSTGKTDRKMLRQAVEVLSPNQLIAYLHDCHVEVIQPSTDDERLVRNIWAEVLRIPSDTINARSNFFHLGGDSVTAMRLVGVARSNGKYLTVADVFRLPTLSEIAHNWVSVDPHAHHGHESSAFSLVNVMDLPSFLAEKISKPFEIEVDMIVDVLPATLHQSFEIQAPCKYLTFTLDYNVDSYHVLRSWRKVVQQYDILRTVFIPYQDGHLQIVLKSLDHDLEYHKTFKGKPEDIIKIDCAAGPPTAGRSPLKIIIMKTTQEVYLTLRISHAQYDGWSFGELLKDWGRAFAGLPLVKKTQFPNFVYTTSRADQKSAYEYWKNLLSAAQTTCFHKPSINGSLNAPVNRIEITRSTDPITVPSDFTVATLAKAAWTLVLAKRLSRPDIVMFQLTSGRRSGRSGIQDTIGPCLVLLPIRIIIQPHWRALDLCQFIQNQDVESMAFDNIELPNIVKNCTDWPSDFQLGSIIHHQSDEWDTSLTLHGSHYKPKGYMEEYIPTDIEVETTFICDRLKIEIDTASNVLREMEVMKIAEEFCSAVEQLSRLDVLTLDFAKA